MSSRTRSTSSTTERSAPQPVSVVIALGSNLGDRAWNLRRALHALAPHVRLARVSSIHETEAIDSPAGSPPYLNMVVSGHTWISPDALLGTLMRIEKALGRVRRGVRNEPRVIDLDLIVYGGHRIRTPSLVVPHPRYREREFVMAPMREVWFT